MDKLTGFRQVTVLEMLQHLFRSYGEIDEIEPKENTVNMMGPYDPVEPLSRLIDQPEKGQEFARPGGLIIANYIMVCVCVLTDLRSQTV